MQKSAAKVINFPDIKPLELTRDMVYDYDGGLDLNRFVTGDKPGTTAIPHNGGYKFFNEKGEVAWLLVKV